MADTSGVDNLTEDSSGSVSLAGIQAAVDNLNTAKQEKGSGVTGNIPTFGSSNVLGDSGLMPPGSAIVGTTDIQTLSNKTISGTNNTLIVREADLSISDNTTANVSTSKHGFVPKAPNDATKYLDGTGAYSTPASLPAGLIQMFAGSSAPSGYLFCDGSAVSRATYATLFGIISTTFGIGDGSTTFNVPDMRGRVPLGVGTGTGGGAGGNGLPTGGSSLTARSLGDWVGEENHTLVIGETPSHAHTLPFATSGSGSETIGTSAGVNQSGATGSTGGDGSHNNIQPVLTVNFIIKT